MVRPFEATRGALQFAAVSAVATTAAIFTAGGRRSGARDGVSAAGEPGCPVGMIRVPHPVFAGRPLSGDPVDSSDVEGSDPHASIPKTRKWTVMAALGQRPGRTKRKRLLGRGFRDTGDWARYSQGGAGACARTL